MKVAIIDYDMGNVGSIYNMLKKIGFKSKITADKKDIREADKLILPGVGAFDHGMKNLEELDLIDILNDKVLSEKVPVLGICLGMHLLTHRSDEGVKKGLGWIDGEVIKFSFDEQNKHLKVPHMGWNTIINFKNGTLTSNFNSEPKFYFVHSFYVDCKKEDDILMTTNYGFDFVSAVHHENIYGVQFHPEKSHKYGMNILKNFMELE
jgi:glutamine amidotransferase